MNNKVPVGIVVLIVLALIGAFLFALNSVTSEETTRDFNTPVVYDDIQERIDSIEPADQLSQIERQSFMKTCNADGTAGQYCQCTLDYLERHNTPQRIRQMGAEVSGSYMPQEMWDAVEYCL